MEKTNTALLINLDNTVAADCRDLMQSAKIDYRELDRPEFALHSLNDQPWQFAIVVVGTQSIGALSALLESWPVLPTLIVHSGCHHAADTAAANGKGHLRICTPSREDITAGIVGLLRDFDGPPSLIAHDPRSRALAKLADRVAATDATVLLTGESGVGKEVYAQYIHQHSDRAQGPFVAINCAAIPESMLEAHLFGHEKGAFTGAHMTRTGKFECAHHGTLLLDEVSEMDLGLQAKLLRVLQEKELERLGSHRNISLDVRVLATSNLDLVQAVEQGRFRKDLFYRLNVFPFAIPPLRERCQDILPLAHYLLARHTRDQRRRRYTPQALAALTSYPWPGNVRELHSVIQRALILSSDAVIDLDTVIAAQLPGAYGGIESNDQSKLAPAMQHAESELIIEALQCDDGNRRRAAERLGISTRTLRYKIARMRKAGIAVPS